MEAEARGDRLQADLHEALTAAMLSKVSVLRGRLHTMYEELQALLQLCQRAWESAGLGWFELPPRAIADGPSEYMPQLAALAEQLEELGDTIQEAVVAGSQDLAAKV
jgi:hypothetical protein